MRLLQLVWFLPARALVVLVGFALRGTDVSSRVIDNLWRLHYTLVFLICVILIWVQLRVRAGKICLALHPKRKFRLRWEMPPTLRRAGRHGQA